MSRRRHSGRQGFTLVEIALAMMVATMGLLVVMGLFIGGLSAQKTSSNETQMALFADHVMNAVRAAAASNWADIVGELHRYGGVPPPVDSEWTAEDKDGDPARIRVVSNPRQMIRFVSRDSGIEEFAVQYTLKIDTDDSRPNSSIKWVRLALWDGYGPTEDEEAIVYYTEVYRTY